MATNGAANKAAGKTYFEQQREALVGEIAIVRNIRAVHCVRMISDSI